MAQVGENWGVLGVQETFQGRAVASVGNLGLWDRASGFLAQCHSGRDRNQDQRKQEGKTPTHLGWRKVQNTHTGGEGLDAHSPEDTGKPRGQRAQRTAALVPALALCTSAWKAILVPFSVFVCPHLWGSVWTQLLLWVSLPQP